MIQTSVCSVRFCLSSTVTCSDAKYEINQNSQDNQVISTRRNLIEMRNQSLKEALQELTFLWRTFITFSFQKLAAFGIEGGKVTYHKIMLATKSSMWAF